jgi:hypothetical protein
MLLEITDRPRRANSSTGILLSDRDDPGFRKRCHNAVVLEPAEIGRAGARGAEELVATLDFVLGLAGGAGHGAEMELRAARRSDVPASMPSVIGAQRTAAEDRCVCWPDSWWAGSASDAPGRASARSSARCVSVERRRRAPWRALPGLIRHAKLLGAMVPGRPPTQSSWTRCSPSSPTNQEL